MNIIPAVALLLMVSGVVGLYLAARRMRGRR